MPGYDVNRVLPDHLRCRTCQLLLRDAVQVETGMLCCQTCVPQDYNNHECKNCRIMKWSPDKAVQNEVMKLRVNCSNYSRGCQWQGDVLSYLKDHLDGCIYKGKSKVSDLERVKQENRKLKLENRHLQRENTQLKQQAAANALELEKIPNLRQQITDLLGNKARYDQACVEAENSKTSSDLLPFHILSSHEDLDDSLTATVHPLAEEVEEPAVPFDDPELSVDVEDGSSVDVSPHMCDDNDDHGDVLYAKHMEELKNLEKRNEAMEPRLDMIDKNSLRFDKDYETVSKATAVASLEPVYQKKFEHGLIPDPNASFVRIELNPLSRNYRYRWKISNVASKTREANANPSQPLVSPPWITHPGGYVLQTHIYFNGNGRCHDKHISVFVAVQRGKNDSVLSWPLKGKISFFLLDQKEKRMPIVRTVLSNLQSHSFQQPASHRNIASGCPDFASVSTLSDGTYVKNDVMFLEFTLNTCS